MTLKSHYSLESVRASFIHFIFGKALTAVMSVLVLLLVARTLPVSQFAAYTVFQGVILIIGLVSSFGVGQTMFRYVPELRAANNNLPMYRMILVGTATRMAVIAGALAIAWWTRDWWAARFGLAQWLPWLLLYLPVGWLRLTNMFMFRTMESLLWQKATQFSLAGGALVRFAAVALLVWQGSLTLKAVILVEIASESVVFISLAGNFLSRRKADPHRTAGDPDWLRQHRARMRRYATWGYLQAVANMLYGGSANRVAASAMLAPGLVGLFGFVDSLMDYGQRYLPTRMLNGMIQPLFFARYSSNGNFQEIGRLANMTFRASVVALGLPGVVLVAGGETILNWLTAGKYGQAAYLLVGLLFVLGMESLRSQLEVMVQAIERNEIFLVSNLALSGSLLVALLLLPQVGLWGFVLGAMAGNALSIAVVLIWFHRLGKGFQFDWGMTSKALAILGLAGLVGVSLTAMTSALWGSGLGALAYLALVLLWPPIKPEERTMLMQLLRRRAPAAV